MRPRNTRHAAAVLAVTIASGILFSVSSLNERKNPAGTSDLATLVRTRQAQVTALQNEVSTLDAQVQSFSTTPQSATPDEDKSRSPTLPPDRFLSARPPTTSSSTSRTSKTP